MAFGINAVARTGTDILHSVSKASHIVSTAIDASSTVTEAWASNADLYKAETLERNRLALEHVTITGYQQHKLRLAKKAEEFEAELEANPKLASAYARISAELDPKATKDS